MQCTKCRKTISSVDDPKRIERRKKPDGTLQDWNVPGFPLKEATGKIVGVFHLKCWYVEQKHDRMGPNGRYLDESPTAYEMSARYKNADDETPEQAAKREAAAAEFGRLEEQRQARLSRTEQTDPSDMGDVGTQDEVHLDAL